MSSRQSRMTTAGAGPARMADRNAQGQPEDRCHRSVRLAQVGRQRGRGRLVLHDPGASRPQLRRSIPRSATIDRHPCTPRAAATAPIYHGRDDLNPQAEDPHRARRRRPGRLRASRRRPVDDEHRHRRCRRHGHPGRAAGACRIRAGPHHGQQRRGGRGGPGHPLQARPARRRRPAHRRLPLQRPPAAHEVPRGGGGARQVPHQSRQRRHQAAGRAVRPDHRGRDCERGAGPHRCELGLPGPAAADRDDGCQRRVCPSPPTAARS